MTPEQFRAILARHGGVMGTEVLDTSKDEEIAGVKTGEKIPPTSVRLKFVTKNGPITARQKDDGTYEILDDPKSLVASADPATSKPMSEYERAQVDRQKTVDARAAETESRLATTARATEGRADRAERGRQLLAELQAKIQQGTLDERKAQTEYEKWKFENYELPRQTRQDAIAERGANRADATDARAAATDARRATTDEYKIGQEAGRDAVDRARLAHTPTVLGNYAKGGLDAAWSTPPPDFDTIAAQAAKRAIDELRGLGAKPPAGPTASGDGLPVAVAARPPVVPPIPVTPIPAPQQPQLQPVGASNAPGRFGQ